MKYLFSLILFFFQFGAFAQATYTIGGTVIEATGAKIQSATVFIAGTQNITATDEQGNFVFRNLLPGNYQLVVNMMGYNSHKQSVTIKSRSETLNIIITGKKNALNEVVVGAKKQLPKDLKRFTRFFLGYMRDPQLCRIVNPGLINFSHTDTTLTATTDDFLIIENEILGYRVKYLLKSFFCKPNGFYFFDGDYTFEPLVGTAKQQRIWNKNRKTAYEGSAMHFLRALYAGTTRKEGFLVYRSTTDDALILERNPSDPQQFVTRKDSNSISVNIKPMVLVVQNKEKAAQLDVISNKEPKKYIMGIGLPQRYTLFKLKAEVDSRGSITGRDTYLDFGYWGVFGVANLLPFEYKPE
ncbi:carboxypeptidase-like regulatory domain-containing protein [Mucilaginibacter panaciglaebae]|uniref:Carboxypeptidase-like regulatory domain-containing protein n=1 Tax=Mucilaginibacter panaciglaebae TaxID=502331 RepID=A0ABP7WF22_9SPHI